MRIKIQLLLCILAGLGFYGCLKIHPISDVPAISFMSFTQYNCDSAALTISFQDGNGDIGALPGDTNNNFYMCYQRDSAGTFVRRWNSNSNDSVVDKFCIRNISPSGPPVKLTGQIRVVLNAPYWYQNLPTVPKDTLVRFRVFLYDRAGHKSNSIYTPGIHIPAVCP